MTKTETLTAIVARLRRARGGPCELLEMSGRQVERYSLGDLVIGMMEDRGETYFSVETRSSSKRLMTGWLGPRSNKDLPGVHVMSWKRGDWEKTLVGAPLRLVGAE